MPAGLRDAAAARSIDDEAFALPAARRATRVPIASEHSSQLFVAPGQQVRLEADCAGASPPRKPCCWSASCSVPSTRAKSIHRQRWRASDAGTRSPVGPEVSFGPACQCAEPARGGAAAIRQRRRRASLEQARVRWWHSPCPGCATSPRNVSRDETRPCRKAPSGKSRPRAPRPRRESTPPAKVAPRLDSTRTSHRRRLLARHAGESPARAAGSLP